MFVELRFDRRKTFQSESFREKSVQFAVKVGREKKIQGELFIPLIFLYFQSFGWTLLLIERRGNGSFKRKPSTRKNHGFAMKYIYRSPCGRSFLTLKEIEEFLLTTNSKLNIKYFIADRVTSLNSTINFDANKIIHLDISQGKERVPISVLNETDRFLPEDFVYGTENVSRFVSIEQIRSRRTCCSCTDK